MSPARYTHSIDVIAGRGSGMELAAEVSGRVSLIADADLLELGAANQLLDAMSKHAAVDVIPGPSGEPTTGGVDAIAAALPSGPHTVIGLGGGSAMDTSKLATTAATLECSTRDLLEEQRPLDNRYRLIAVPTTAGSGSEVTRTAVVSDGGRKTWAWGAALRPQLAVLEPELTRSCPPGVTAAAGLDALVHACAAATGRTRQPFATAAALEAIRLLAEHLPRVVLDGDDLDGRQAVQLAATLAGTAIDACGTGVAHAIGHALSTVHGTPHGTAVALGLRASIDWSLEEAAEAYRPVAPAMANGAIGTDLPALLDSFYEEIGFASLARDALPDEPDEAAIASALGAPENQPMRANSSRVPAPEDLATLAALTVHTWARWAAA